MVSPPPIPVVVPDYVPLAGDAVGLVASVPAAEVAPAGERRSFDPVAHEPRALSWISLARLQGRGGSTIGAVAT